MRILPDGSVLVADTDRVLHYNSAGTLIKTYTLPRGTALFALNLDPDGTSFWTGNIDSTGEIYKVDIGSGTVLEDFTTSPFVDVAGLNVFGEITVATSTPEPSSILLLIAPIGTLIAWRVRRRQA